MTNGTPKSLIEAIQNGIEEAGIDAPAEVAAKIAKRHIRDFLSQKFAVGLMRADLNGEVVSSIEKLFSEITGEVK